MTRIVVLRLVPALLLMLVAAAAAPGLGNWCQFSPDSFEYLTVARSLVEHRQFPDRAITHPPGLPILLAPLVYFDHLPMIAIRLVMLVAWAGATLLTYRYHRPRLGDAWAFAAAAMVATSSVLLVQTTFILSEPVFMVLVMAAICAAARFQRASDSKLTATPGSALRLGLLTGAAVLVRTLGIVLIPVLAVAIWRAPAVPTRRRLTLLAIFAAAALLPAAVWQVRQSGYTDEGRGYARSWLEARSVEHTSATGLTLQGQRLVRFLPTRLAQLKAVVIPQRLGYRLFQQPHDTWSTWAIGGTLILLSVLSAWRRCEPGDFFLLITFGVLVFWPWEENERLVLPFLPFLCGYIAWIAARLWERSRGMSAGRALLVLALVGISLCLVVELIAKQSILAARKAKHEALLTDSRRLAAAMRAAEPATAREVVGIVPDGSAAKVLFMGAAYLAGFESRIVDVELTHGEALFTLKPSEKAAWVPAEADLSTASDHTPNEPLRARMRLGNDWVKSPHNTSLSFRRQVIVGDLLNDKR